MDWDKLRIFHAAAKVGSFTHAGSMLGLSQSAVSRQVGALEGDLQVPLFHRHARGLILTEQGEVLYRTVQDVMAKLDQARTRLNESRERPNGDLRITTNVAIGTGWLTPRLGEFLDLYPDIRLHLILTDEELDLGMRAADVALRLREPVQPDLIRRRLFTVHYHLYASVDYVKYHGQPQRIEDLDDHRLISYDAAAASYLDDLNAPLHIGRNAKHPRLSALSVTNIIALQKAVEQGVGIGVLPDYLKTSQVVQIMTDAVTPELECYLVYPEELKSVARIQVFRDFLVSSAQRWNF
ncbi:LysR family transcriptional regulator [Beijerinckia indica]|uniref:Transcriptional regulator, LysR family n=1 Tax=Beijerinckia indica subsp. indica (strain ATCC 9039 / DSM 1715 / NCIMB 8712) TaxID=395963 RepID=B2IB14_BEII9|nr:LysR family transcriptional regulator [Beijerinckia indica]ACB93714.1 transcriptional regulator, LysR family [Beijerinckia indica subsp. indica ATCC 9039]